MGIFSKITSKIAASADIFTTGSRSSSHKTTGMGPRSKRWFAPNYGPKAVLQHSGPRLRDQSRDAIRKSPVAATALERIVSNVVGTGIKPQIPNKVLNRLWTLWTDQASGDGQSDFYGMETLIMRAMAESGDAFAIRRVRKLDEGLIVPLQFDILESDYVPFEKNGLNPETGNPIIQGIEFDKECPSRRVGYWVHRFHPADKLPDSIPNEPEFVPASEVLHIYLPLRPGQIRGEPWLARVLSKLHDLDGYQESELERKKLVSMFAAFIRRPLPQGMDDADLIEMWNQVDADGGVTLEPATVQVLAPNEDITFAEPKDLAGAYEIYIRTIHQEIAAAVGITYEQLTGDFSKMNDRTWRSAMNEFRRRVEVWQHQLMVFQFCRPAFDFWLDAVSMAHPEIEIDEGFVPVWVAQAWAHIHPLQDVQADLLAVRAGFKSREQVISARGEDIELIDAQQAADNARADALGLKFESDARDLANTGPLYSPQEDAEGEQEQPADEGKTERQDAPVSARARFNK